MKPCIYILQSLKDGNQYIGSTFNIDRRLSEHNRGKVKSTKRRRPLKLIGIRKFDNIADASLWEKKYKKSHGQLERDIRNKNITTL